MEINNEHWFLLIKTHTHIKNYVKLWDKIKDLINSMINTSGYFDENYMKRKFNPDNNWSLNKILKLHNLIIVVRFIFQEDKKYYPQVFLGECL